MARDHLHFEYTGPDDSSRIVPSAELSESEVLRRLQKILKGMSVVPLRLDEYDSTHQPSSFYFLSELFSSSV